jgi:translation initiation factor 1
MKTGRGRGGLVYSTEGGRMCPACRKALALCSCTRPSPPRASDGIVRVARETKGRAGKGVTLVTGLALESAALTTLCKQLKSSCGAGGTVKEGVIEIQGDHRDAVIGSLQKQGWTVKRAGD